MHISIKAETLFNLFGLPVTNSLISSWIVLILFTVVAFIFTQQFHNKKSPLASGNRFVFFIMFMVNGLYTLFKPLMKDKDKVFFPILASFFFFILLSNWFGLLPGVGSVVVHKQSPAVEKIAVDYHGTGESEYAETIPLLRGSTADLNTTIALALTSVILIQYFGIHYLGFGGYFGRFINLKSPVAFFTGILETVSEISKVISFAFRLFGNIFAGEVLLVVIAFLIPILASFPFLLLEIFVGLIQALVFAMLTGVFLTMATTEHH